MARDLIEQIEYYCAYQERCHSEVRKKLYELSFSEEDIEEVILHLITEDFLNEERFARSFCRGKFGIKKWGRLKIQKSLKQKQVSDYCIKKGMEEIDEATYLSTLEELFLKKKAELVKEINVWVKRKKISDFLFRKGYETELIYPLLQKLS